MLRLLIKTALFPVVLVLTVFEKVCDAAVNLSGLVHHFPISWTFPIVSQF